MEKKYVTMSQELVEVKLNIVKEQHEKFLKEHDFKMRVLNLKLQLHKKKYEILGISHDDNS